MDEHSFDAFTRHFSRIHATRRKTVGALVTGLAAAALGQTVAAQDATPIAEDDEPEFLFVQLANQGTWVPSPDEPDVFILTLTGASNQTVFFSDRPQRIVGSVPTTQVFAALGFTPENAPNAAIVAQDETGQRDVLMVELFDPIFQQESGENPASTLVFKSRVLNDYAGTSLDEWQSAQEDDELAAELTNVNLYIEDCVDLIWCNRDYHSWGPVPGGPISLCWNQHALDCVPCNGGTIQSYNDACNREYPDCIGSCRADVAYYR
ncbi:MAG: hypothetical protein R2848_19350 [Thermomicrobiales bacterium]